MPTTEEMMNAFPRGLILPWYAQSGHLPQGWAICDGTNGTPDLRNKFMRGVSDFADVGKTGGSDSHSHHVDALTSYEQAGTRNGPEGADNYTGAPNWNHKHRLKDDTSIESSLPPYLTVLFIMKT